jgi:hypothetical protein
MSSRNVIKTSAALRRLDEIRGVATWRSPSVRVLAAYAQHTTCGLATLGFAAGVDFDKLLTKTPFEADFGQSPFALQRGRAFEEMLRRNDYAATIDVLRGLLPIPATGARTVNLREGFPAGPDRMPLRARTTLAELERIIRRDPGAPHLLDGAVLAAPVGGQQAYFEADALAACSEWTIHAAEVKSFPKVDDRVDPDKLGAALDQVAFYILLARAAVLGLGGDPERFVSDRALLITPKNVGMTRTSLYRHRRLDPAPLAVVLWQLGAERFAPAAVAWGDRRDHLQMAVAGEPRNRDLAFAALLPFARWFNPHFEAHVAGCEELNRGEYTLRRARTAPQVLAANRGTVKMFGDLGRRLAYLPTTGPRPADDEALVRLGRHLLFLWDRAAVPGQQLLICLTDLLGDHWATPQSEFERQSLAALDAYIDPPLGEHGFEAAARAEEHPVGPVPAGKDDEDLMPLVERFNELRAGGTSPAVIRPLQGPIEAHYGRLVDRTWGLLWRCRDCEAAFPEARSVGRRWDADREAYTRHMDWLARSGLRRARQTPRQAALTLRNLEDARSLVEAEEACDDPLRMVPYLLQNKAVRGRVVAVDHNYCERASRSMVRRPLVTLLSPAPCPIPVGKELWWVGQPDGREFVVHEVKPAAGGGSEITLKRSTSRDTTGLPAVGDEACFSVHTTGSGYFTRLPKADPWTHRPATQAVPGPIEDEEQRG